MRLNGENDHPNTPITADADVSTSLSKFSFNTTNNIVSSKSSNNHSSIHTKMNVTTSTNTQNLPSSVQVAVRVRPILTSENGSHQCITIHHSAIDSTPSSSPNIANMVEIGSSGSNKGSKKFVFDACFSPKATQREVFEHSVQPLINACLDGYNATVLAVSLLKVEDVLVWFEYFSLHFFSYSTTVWTDWVRQNAYHIRTIS